MPFYMDTVTRLDITLPGVRAVSNMMRVDPSTIEAAFVGTEGLYFILNLEGKRYYCHRPLGSPPEDVVTDEVIRWMRGDDIKLGTKTGEQLRFRIDYRLYGYPVEGKVDYIDKLPTYKERLRESLEAATPKDANGESDFLKAWTIQGASDDTDTKNHNG